MKITIQENDQQPEIEVVIHCRQTDEQVLGLVSALSGCGKKLVGTKDGASFLLTPGDILYFDSVDKRTFAYTQRETYEMPMRLYELEERLPGGFFRASKASIINIGKIKSILPDFGGRLSVTLISGERLTVSRQYAHELKTRLGL